MDSVQQVEVREQWNSRTEYFLVMASYCVGVGDIWRFPYLLYISGGDMYSDGRQGMHNAGAYLIPMLIMLVLVGLPLVYMEMAVGRYTRSGPVASIRKMCPLFQAQNGVLALVQTMPPHHTLQEFPIRKNRSKGIGLGSVVMSFMIATHYVTIICWAFYYLFSIFQSTLPWLGCDNAWNSDLCWVNTTNVTEPPDNYQSPTEEYFERRVLNLTSGIDETGGMHWEMFGFLILSWVLVYFCIWRGPNSAGKVVYFTVTVPFLVLIIMLVRGVTLPGAELGIRFFITPEWENLLDPKVWVYAAVMVLHSLGLVIGGMINISSYSTSPHCFLKDAIFFIVLDAVTAMLAGFAMFSCMGNMAYTKGTSVSQVLVLVFIIYPEALNSFPVPQFFSFLFFFMLVCLGINSQGGMWFFALLDYYAASVSYIILAFFEVAAITWCYGREFLYSPHSQGPRVGDGLFVCGTTAGEEFSGLFIFSLVLYKLLTVAGYTYPLWAQVFGWVIALTSVSCIPVGMVHAVYTAQGSNIVGKLRNSLKPTVDAKWKDEAKKRMTPIPSVQQHVSQPPAPVADMVNEETCYTQF